MAEKQIGRSEFEGCLTVSSGQLCIGMQSRNLDDAGVEKWCSWMDDCLEDFVRNKRLRRETDGFLLCREANFSANMIGDLGGRALLRVLFTHKIAVRIVKLFKNHLGRAFASSMMDWLTITPVPAVELHLSHNYIPREGAVDILKAVGHNKVYPAKNLNGTQQPLWLRLEQNIVEKPDELLRVAEEQLRAPGASPGAAPLSLDNVPRAVAADQPCPLAQVAYLTNQRDHRRGVPPEAQRWRAQAGPKEAFRWRISISPEQAEQAEQAAKAPTVSLVRAKTGPTPEPRDRADSEVVLFPSEREEAREGPSSVWNGLPASEQLAKKKAPPMAPPDALEDESDENSDEAPGPVSHVRRAVRRLRWKPSGTRTRPPHPQLPW
ncbi:unnamed protein product [Durusdinium trenchii]